MIAIVKSVKDGIVVARVRRNSRDEILYGRHDDLKVGDRVEVLRKTNNPYLVRNTGIGTNATIKRMI